MEHAGDQQMADSSYKAGQQKMQHTRHQHNGHPTYAWRRGPQEGTIGIGPMDHQRRGYTQGNSKNILRQPKGTIKCVNSA